MATVTDKHVFFWSGPFSNWHPAKFTYKGIEFNCAEQAMMWEKADIFGDEPMKARILSTDSPKEQKALGKLVANFDVEKWQAVCVDLIIEVLYCKFTQNEVLRQHIMMFDTKTFVEASPYDTVWGIGMAENAEGIDDPANWKGKNFLGICLTNVRDRILAESL